MAQADERGQLRTVGALVEGHQEIRFAALAPFQSLQETFTRDLVVANGRLSSAEIFAYYLERANGQTIEFSEPFDVEAPSADAAAAQVIARTR